MEVCCQQAHHEGVNIFFEAVILPSLKETLRAPALGLLPAVVNCLQAARQVGVLGYMPAADFVICSYPSCHHWHH